MRTNTPEGAFTAPDALYKSGGSHTDTNHASPGSHQGLDYRRTSGPRCFGRCNPTLPDTSPTDSSSCESWSDSDMGSSDAPAYSLSVSLSASCPVYYSQCLPLSG